MPPAGLIDRKHGCGSPLARCGCNRGEVWLKVRADVAHAPEYTSAAYLKNCGVEPGDLFLFFGNFHFAAYKNGKYSYIKDTGNFYRDRDLQVIWGYLQVGKILIDCQNQKQLWWHPHSSDAFRKKSSNIIYLAVDRLSFNPGMPGAGILMFDQKRVLTKEGSSKATWKMNQVYSPSCLTGCRRKNSSPDSNGIYYAGIWQELCLKESEECSAWAKNIIL